MASRLDMFPGASVALPPGGMRKVKTETDRDEVAAENDVRLVSAVAARDRPALAALHRRHAPWLLERARRQVGAQDAADLVQEVFLQLWRQADRYDANRGSVAGWLTVLLRSRSVDHLRRRRSDDREATDDLASAAPPMTELLTVRRAWLALPAAQRQVVQLAYFDGLTCVEVADALAIPVGTMKWRMAAALDTLRARFGVDPPRDRRTRAPL
jgi:RNA polymerase sigma-70 factor (ECF subfamily)